MSSSDEESQESVNNETSAAAAAAVEESSDVKKLSKKTLTVVEKLEWVEKFNASGQRLSKFLEGKSIPYSTFSGWVNDFKDGHLTKERASESFKRHRVRRANDHKPVEDELVLYIRQRIASASKPSKGSQSWVSWASMRDKAMKFAQRRLYGEQLANFIVTDSWLKKVLRRNGLSEQVAPYKPDNKWHLRLARQFQLQAQQGTPSSARHQGQYPPDEIDDELAFGTGGGMGAGSGGGLSIAGIAALVPPFDSEHVFGISVQPRPTDVEVDEASRVLMRLSHNSRSKALQVAVRRLAFEIFQERLVLPFGVAEGSSSSSSAAAGVPNGSFSARKEKSKERSSDKTNNSQAQGNDAKKSKKDDESDDDDDESDSDDESDEDNGN